MLSKQQLNENFGDLHKPLNKLQAMTEASRCTYCYDAPCINACPTSIDIPTFIHQIKTQNTEGAAQTILSANIMGGTCARACPTEVLCEQDCVRNHDQGKPVEIGLLQRFAVDHLMAQEGPHPFTRAADTGKHLAVVGAGPAGLSFAHRASMLGHRVTVFEAREKPGGLNEYGLASYKMVNDFAQREVDFLLGIGAIEIKHQQRLGSDISLAQLEQQFDGVFIGLGLGATNALNLENEKLEGVKDAIEFIDDLRQTEDISSVLPGQNVVVIGGGNTAIDAAVQSKRLGARQVHLVYRRGEKNMSATDWEVDLARKNDVIVHLWSSPASLSGNGKIESITFDETREVDGKLQPTGNTFTLQADCVLKAIGQTLIMEHLEGIEFENNKIKVNSHFQTSRPKVFAGGDCIASGEDLTVQAVEDGKRAAIAMTSVLFGINDKEQNHE